MRLTLRYEGFVPTCLVHYLSAPQVQINAYFEALLKNPSGVRSLADLIKFNDVYPELEEPAGFEDQSGYAARFTFRSFPQSDDVGRLIASEATNGFDAAYFAALAADHDLGSTRGIDFVLKKFNLDALVLPAPGFTSVPAGI